MCRCSPWRCSGSETYFWSLRRYTQAPNTHIPGRGEEEERPVLVLGACRAPWHPARSTPLFRVQAVQVAARSQAGSVRFTLQKQLLLERQKEGRLERREVIAGCLWEGQVSVFQNKKTVPARADLEGKVYRSSYKSGLAREAAPKAVCSLGNQREAPLFLGRPCSLPRQVLICT